MGYNAGIDSIPAPAAYLTPADREAIDVLVARLEARTGVQIVPAIVGKADNYAELPWKAFAMGASLAGFGLVLADYLRPRWVTADTVLLDVTILLVIACGSALLAIFVPPFARLFLRPARSEAEVRQYAQALFLHLGLFATRRRTACLILVSLFERRIEIVADTGLSGRVSEADWHAVIAGMAPRLRERQPFPALRDALAAVESLLVDKGFQAAGDGRDELPNRTIEERGQ